MKKNASVFLGIVFVFVALGAIPAGYSLIAEPDGSGLKMSKEMLQGSPFSDFFIPGLALLVVNGVINLVAAVFCFKKRKIAGYFGICLGLFMLAWIAVQVYSIGLNHILQPVYFVIGILEIYLGYSILQGAKPTEK